MLEVEVQQRSLAGDLERLRAAREDAHRKLAKVLETKVTALAEEEEEEEEGESESGTTGDVAPHHHDDEGSSEGVGGSGEEDDNEHYEKDSDGEDNGDGVLMTQKQRQKEKRRKDKKDQRRFTKAQAPPLPSAPLRQLSGDSQAALDHLRGKDGSGGISGSAKVSSSDVNRAQRYLEEAAVAAAAVSTSTVTEEASSTSSLASNPHPLSRPAPHHHHHKAALLSAVSGGDVDSAARALRHGSVASHLRQQASGGGGGGEKTAKQHKKKEAKRQAVAAAKAQSKVCCACCGGTVFSKDRVTLKEEKALALAAEEAAEKHATCVNGHFLHSLCFLGLLAFAPEQALPSSSSSGSSSSCWASGSWAGSLMPVCPTCAEPLAAPPVEKVVRRPAAAAADGQQADDTDCGGGGGAGGGGGGESAVEAATEHYLDALAVRGREFADEQTSTADRSAAERLLDNARQCPACSAGPVVNPNCADLDYHNGQCPKCSTRVANKAALNSAVANRKPGVSVTAAVPFCVHCATNGGGRVQVLYNGCWRCGFSFKGGWSTLPPFDDSKDGGAWKEARGVQVRTEGHLSDRAIFLRNVRRNRAATRAVAGLTAEVAGLALLLGHDTRAIEDEKRRRKP
jgi:hypothetical protein